MPRTQKALQWLSLVGAIWLQSFNGTNSDFPAYSSQLKQLLSLSQLQLNNLAFASDAGKLLGWVSGLAAVHLPLWLVLLIGSTLGLIGYGFQYLFVTHTISNLSYSHVFLLTILAGNSICWINTVCSIVAIKNFPFDRQVALGITASYSSLSAKVYANVVNAVQSSPAKRAEFYLLFNSIFPLLACIFTAPMVREIHNHAENLPMRRCTGFVVMFVITIGTGSYAVLGSLDLVSTKAVLPPVENLTGIVVCLLSPLVIPVAEQIRGVLEETWSLNSVKKVHNSAEMSALENGRVIKEEDDDQALDHHHHHHHHHGDYGKSGVKEEIGLKLLVQRVDFWLYFCVYFSGATLGLVYSNNLGQIAESRGCSATSSLVSLSASMGFFGRLIPSLIDYFFSRSNYMIAGPASIATLMAPMAGAFILLVIESNVALYTSTAIIGLCTGAIASISVATTAELFGTKNFGVNHNIVVANIPIGSFVFGSSAALVYNREGSDGDGKCMGMACYRNTFIFWCAVCLFGTFLALILYSRTRKFYTQRYINCTKN